MWIQCIFLSGCVAFSLPCALLSVVMLRGMLMSGADSLWTPVLIGFPIAVFWAGALLLVRIYLSKRVTRMHALALSAFYVTGLAYADLWLASGHGGESFFPVWMRFVPVAVVIIPLVHAVIVFLKGERYTGKAANTQGV